MVEPLPALESAAGVEDLSSAKKRIVLLECMAEQARAAAEIARREASVALRHVARLEQRELELGALLRKREADLEAKARDVADFASAAKNAESARDEALTRLRAVEGGLQVEVEALRDRLAEERFKATLCQERLADLADRQRFLERAHDRMFARILEWHRLVNQDNAEALDLAEFISSLRAEVIEIQQMLKRSAAREADLRAALEQRGIAPLDGVDGLNGEASGSADRTETRPLGDDPAVQALLAGRSDRPWIEHLLGELAAGPPRVRARAAERLIDLLGAKASPFVAAAARQECPEDLRAELVVLLGRIGRLEVATLIAGFAEDGSARVRSAVLDAWVVAVGSDPQACRNRLEEALGDPDPRVRRRALLHLATMPGPSDRGARLLDDPDPATRRLACASLTGTRDQKTLLRLVDALLDSDARVRDAAARALTPVLGRPVGDLLGLGEDERRSLVGVIRSHLDSSAELQASQGRLLETEWPGSFMQPAEHTPVEPPPLPSEPTFDRIAAVLLASLRGCTREQLARELGCDAIRLERALDPCLRDGRLVLRGRRLFLP